MTASSAEPPAGAGRSARARLRDWTIDETWAIGIVDRPIASFLDDPGLGDARWIEAPRGAYYADPFGVPGADCLFCERLDHRDGIGRLVALDIGPEGGVRERPTGLCVEGHASFPFLIEDAGDLLCLPETVAEGRLTLWRRGACGRWGLDRVVATDVAAIDPVLFRHGGLCWLAYTDGRIGSDDNLCLFHAPAFAGPWTPHALNPVVRGKAGGRSAGTPFWAGGALHRPAQDCTNGYGGAVIVHRVERLDPDGFHETPAVRVAPGPKARFPAGAHTLSAWGGRTLIDAKRHGVVAAGLRRRVVGRAGRWIGRARAGGGGT